MDIEVITAPVADEENALDAGLVALTKAIETIAPDALGWGFLGGPYGYGANYENAVFLMHPACGCERTDCKWCEDEGCGCPISEPRYEIDGTPASQDEAFRLTDQITNSKPKPKFGTSAYDARVAEIRSRIRIIYPARIHTCDPRGMMADRQEGEDDRPNQRAPNFWHKPSGLRVWWHKWIGRSMEVVGADGLDLENVFAECVASLQGVATPQSH